MFGTFRKKDNNNSNKKDNNIYQPNISNEAELNNAILSKNLNKNMESFRSFVGKNHGVTSRELELNVNEGTNATIVFIDGLVDKTSLNNSLIRPLLTDLIEKKLPPKLLNIIEEKIIRNLKVKQSTSWNEILDDIFSGDAALFINGYNTVIMVGLRKWSDRGVQEALGEQVIFGPKDSFSETLLTSITLVRRRIKSPRLQMEYLRLGTLTKTDIIIAYVDGIVNPHIVDEIKARISRIKIDGILSSNTIEELIEDSPFAAFPQIIQTERPDKTAGHLLEGGIAVLVDGTPMVLLMPIVFWQFIYSPQDYNQRLYTTFLLRFLRLGSLITALTLPSFYIAVTTFHPEMIPIGLLQVIASGRRDVPFPILVEVMIMEIILEIIREAGARLPKNVGQAISIVGGLVLGQAAIQAKLASPATVTVVALTAIANFTIPSFSAALSVRTLRFFLMVSAGFLGIFGFISAIFIILVQMCSLRSFGIPFLAPISPTIPSDIKDTLIRAPAWLMSKRPKTFGAVDSTRQKPGLKPGPHQDGGPSTRGKKYD